MYDATGRDWKQKIRKEKRKKEKKGPSVLNALNRKIESVTLLTPRQVVRKRNPVRCT